MSGLYNFGSEYAQTYSKECSCGKAVEVSTQKDNNPEYYTEIWVKCACGKEMKFDIPVN